MMTIINTDGLRFKFSITDADGNEIVSDYTYLTNIDEFGGCESVDIHVASALRFLRRELLRKQLSPVEVAD